MTIEPNRIRTRKLLVVAQNILINTDTSGGVANITRFRADGILPVGRLLARALDTSQSALRDEAQEAPGSYKARSSRLVYLVVNNAAATLRCAQRLRTVRYVPILTFGSLYLPEVSGSRQNYGGKMAQ